METKTFWLWGQVRRSIASIQDHTDISPGLHGLVTAKVMLHDSASYFRSVTIFEKNTELGGVWSSNHIYDGLTTNSPLLTYEIPIFHIHKGFAQQEPMLVAKMSILTSMPMPSTTVSWIVYATKRK